MISVPLRVEEREDMWTDKHCHSLFVVCMFIFSETSIQPTHACISVHWCDLESVCLKVYDVYSPIWGRVVLPLCSSQESPQQEGWCQGKRARLLSRLLPCSPSLASLASSYPWLPFHRSPDVLLLSELLLLFHKYFDERQIALELMWFFFFVVVAFTLIF